MFDGAKNNDIVKLLQIWLDDSGQVSLIDGRTEMFDRKVTVGYVTCWSTSFSWW